MDLKESIKEILSEKKARKEGLHINHIVAHIINRDKNLESTPRSGFSKIGFKQSLK